MKTILFQGDSITDAHRSRENNSNCGIGYPTLVASEIGYEFPNKYNFLNRGISGDRVVDLYARIKSDIINLKPDIMSILIGVNDVWHEIGWENGVDTAKYEKIYNMLIEEIKSALPEVKIMILEPFVLEGGATREQYGCFRSGVEEKAAAARRVAEKNSLKFIPLMKKFDDAYKKAPSGYFLGDGVHPTAMGHELIKREWIKAFKEL